MNVCMYDEVVLNDIKFDNKPYKKNIKIYNDFKSVYYIDIMYNKYIQIPKYKIIDISLEDNSISLCIDDVFYKSFIEPLENHIKDMVYKNSDRIFYKSFSKEKISNCFVSNVEFTDSIILKLNLSNFVSIYNRNKERIDLPILHKNFIDGFGDDIRSFGDDIRSFRGDIRSLEVVSILCIENLQFIDNLFTCNIKIEQLKVYNDIKLMEYSIIESVSEDKNLDDENVKMVRMIDNDSSENLELQYMCSSDSVLLEDEYFKG